MTELTADGFLAPAWVDADDPVKKSLRVRVVWQPLVYINDKLVHPYGLDLGVDPLPEFSVTLRVAHVELVADRSRAVQRAVAGVADEVRPFVRDLGGLTTDYLERLLYKTLRNRGFPLP